MYIVGAGLSGLIAAYVFPQARIIELLSEADLIARHHRALLRFRTDDIGRMTGIEFKKVRVHKGIYHGKDFVPPSIAMANMYSRKVINRVADRSIWNLDPVDRFVAPDDFQLQLYQALRPRVSCNMALGDLELQALERPIVSTIPLNIALATMDMAAPPEIIFERTPIMVVRAKVDHCDTYQTVYYPSPKHAVYRASITGDNLIIELVTAYIDREPSAPTMERVIAFVAETMGLNEADIHDVTVTRQAFGKIAPINESFRRQAILALTVKHNVFSAGRFAIWKNILLDDLLDDLTLIKRMITRGDNYDHMKGSHK